MNVLHGIDGLADVPRGSVMSIGNFDGLHRGHDRVVHVGVLLRREAVVDIGLVVDAPPGDLVGRIGR